MMITNFSKATTTTTVLASVLMMVIMIGGTCLMMAHPSSSFTPSLQYPHHKLHKSFIAATTITMSVQASRLPLLEDSTASQKKKLSLPTAVLSAALMLGTVLSPPSPTIGTQQQQQQLLVPSAHAVESKVVGALKGSGLVFKDTLQIERFEDPKVQGVVLYISNFDRPITEKISGGNFFNDPSYASVACARTAGAKIAIADNIAKGTGGEEVFEESRSLLFKTLRVQRVYDEEKKTVVYVSYNTRLDKGDDSNKSRFKSSLCAVNLE